MDEEYWSKDNVTGVGAGITASPIIVNEKIIFGAHDTFIYALDIHTGKIVWKFKTGDAITSSPVYFEDSVCIGSNDGFLYCLSPEGKFRWKFYTGSRVVGSPTYGNKMIVFGADNGILFALDLDGNLLWNFRTGGAIRTTPAMVNSNIIFGSHDHQLYCLDKNGLEEWKFITGGPMWTSPCIVDKGGKLLWSLHNKIVNKSENFTIYFGSFDGGLYCLDNRGNFKWKFHTGGLAASGPEFRKGIIFFGSSDGYFYAVDFRNGSLIWKFRATGKLTGSSPAFYKDDIFIGDYLITEESTGGNLYCIDSKGKMKWSFKTNHAIVSTPLVHKGILFVGCWDGYLYSIDIKNHELVWKFRTLFSSLNFDVATSLKHSEFLEDKTRQIFSVWKPETLKPTEKRLTENIYTSGSRDYSRNVTTYGGIADEGRFSYSSADNYKGKQEYKSKKKASYK